ncbi:uncharacterized protein FOMMEDRAFT_153453 [Fomitiporia mediterranea MF3/22]|uniref:uncharacterized protein n=1 Tax=Fomitiporia mediterranea (strain MF3/22) TaxID=694068 RepID=UPI0004408128|nr:uncharacterized protein FOMMEDRAFT_153453 [Fomitiporia mediterranea MF3/22]EJD06090.1 hypothetical protein FOMMEDRAFT_153453 [Fomitiporia mediterranea MF3/22]
MHIVQIKVSGTSPLVSYFLDVAGNPALLCVLGSHLLINLKEAGELGVNGGTNYRSKTRNRYTAGAPAAADSNGEGTSSFCSGKIAAADLNGEGTSSVYVADDPAAAVPNGEGISSVCTVGASDPILNGEGASIV